MSNPSWSETASALEQLGFIREQLPPPPRTRIESGYALASSWSSARGKQSAAKSSWLEWWNEHGLLAWEVKSQRLLGLADDERQQLGLTAPEEDLDYYIDPRRAFIVSGQLICPHSALVGDSSGFRSSGYGHSTGWNTYASNRASSGRDWWAWWRNNGRVAWELPSLKVTLPDLERAVHGLPAAAEGVFYLIDPLQAFVIESALYFPFDALVGHIAPQELEVSKA